MPTNTAPFFPSYAFRLRQPLISRGALSDRPAYFPMAYSVFRISRPVSHLEFVIGQCAPLVFGRPYAKHNGIV